MRHLLKSLLLVGLGAAVLALGGCDLSELNENPNKPTSTKPGELLTNAQIDFANLYWRDYPGAFWMRYSQHLTTNQYTTADRFGFPSRRSSSNDFNWNQSYLILNDLEEIIRQNQESPDQTSAFGPSENQIAIARIMQAYIFQFLTDTYGPVPFEEALKGQTEENFSPAYTSQETVYTSLIASLTEASNQIDPGAPTLSSGDLMYGGDMTKWKKFANALKLRLAMRMSEVNAGAAETAINEAVSAGAFESNADNALMPFNSSPPYQNPIAENYQQGRDDWAAPRSIVSVMNGTEDPRRPAFFSDADPNESGNQFHGFPYGLPQERAQPLFQNPDSAFSRPSQRVRRPDAPAILMLYDEVLFIMAEAKFRSDLSVPNINRSADELYREAITASAKYWGGVDDAAINEFLSRIDTPNSGDFDLDQDLGVQKWIAQYLQGLQAWSTWRRHDFQGVLQVPPGNPGQGTFGREIAVRMAYPDAEATLNASNLNDAVNNKLGGSGVSVDQDDQGILVWWDVEYVPPR